MQEQNNDHRVWRKKIDLLTVQQKEAPMNYRILRIVAVSMCVYTVPVYSMLDPMKLVEISTTTKKTKFTEKYEKAPVSADTQFKKRKFANAMYAVATLAMMGIDIANYCSTEKGLLEQKFDHINHLCECPSIMSDCTVQDVTGLSYSCRQTEGSHILYGINDVITAWRLTAGCKNLYDIYQINSALNKQSVTEYTSSMSLFWPSLQICGSGITSTIASVAGILHGVQNYPRTIAVWGANAIIDALGAYNSYENIKIFQEPTSPREK